MAEPARVATVAGAMLAAVPRLAASGIENPRRDANILLGECLACDPLNLVRRRDMALNLEQVECFEAMIARRAGGEPVSRIVGRRGFWTLDLEISRSVLDPRPDSETLVEAALELLPDVRAVSRICDLGTGSGCLLLAVLAERPGAEGIGIDRSFEALRTARRNAIANGLADRARFVAGDWGRALAGTFDLMLCNPPYVASDEIAGLSAEVRLHDPLMALDGGPDGLDAYRAVLADARRLLRPEGAVVFECGAGQADEVAGLCRSAGFTHLAKRHDLAGIERCVTARAGG